MRRYVLTGAPGSGKTSIADRLRASGFSTVEEAATSVIARRQASGDDEPWTRTDFVDEIVRLQRDRQEAADKLPGIHVYDRSPICAHALSVHLGRPISPVLRAELARIADEHVYEPRVFFVRSLGFCEPTVARRISFEESLAFEKVHEESYRAFGFELVDVPAGPLEERVAAVVSAIEG